MQLRPAAGRAHYANNFDLIRLLAALQVAVSHAFAWLQVPLPFVAAEGMKAIPGVAIFFVISGFLITRSYVERPTALRVYLSHRALRIYPALWLQYAGVIVLMAATGGFFASTLADARFWKWLLSAMLVGSNFWASVITAYTPFSYDGLYKWYPADVLWTIPVEIGFYLLVPIVFAPVLARRGLGGAVLLGTFLLSVVAAYLAGPLLRDHGNLNTTGMIHSSPLPYFWLFLAGGAAALYWHRVRRVFEGRAHWWIAAYLALGALNWQIAGTWFLPYRMPDALTVPRALVLAGAVVSFAHSYTWLSRWMRGVDLSYGLYLFHLPLPFGLYYAGVHGTLWHVAASIAMAFVLAAISWFLVEKPSLDLKAVVARSRWLGGPARAAV